LSRAILSRAVLSRAVFAALFCRGTILCYSLTII
jgi:hypothetical protein